MWTFCIKSASGLGKIFLVMNFANPSFCRYFFISIPAVPQTGSLLFHHMIMLWLCIQYVLSSILWHLYYILIQLFKSNVYTIQLHINTICYSCYINVWNTVHVMYIPYVVIASSNIREAVMLREMLLASIPTTPWLALEGREGMVLTWGSMKVRCVAKWVLFLRLAHSCVCFATSLDVTQVITAYIHLKHI